MLPSMPNLIAPPSGSQRYVAPVVENGAENLTGRRYSGGQTHEVLLPLGAATTVTPAWTEPLGAATTVTPAWTELMGAATTVAPAWTGPLVRRNLARASRVHEAQNYSASRITCGTSSLL